MNTPVNQYLLKQKGWLFRGETSPVLFIIFLMVLITLVLYKVIFISNLTTQPSYWTIYGLIATTFLISRLPYSYLHKDNHTAIYEKTDYPTVSVVIAAKDEEESIFETVRSCVESIYPSNIECIVIDDGSSDKTSLEVLRAEKMYGSELVKLIKFPINKGKREAMTAGIYQSKNEIVIFVDSDSFLSPHAMRHINEHFMASEKVGAVSGNTKAENADVNLLTRIQSIQYAVSFDIYKAGESVHRSVTCCPGCFSAYRRNAILPTLEAWRYHKFFGSQSTFGDDRGLTNYILQEWQIVYCQKALASTKVPEKFSVYLKQQLRWKKSWFRESLFAATFIWKKVHPLSSLAFYINFSFPIIGPILAGFIIWKSVSTHNPVIFILFVAGFVLLGIVFALYVRVYAQAKNWMYMPFLSLLFISLFIWQMPYALLTINKTGWGTR